MMLTSLQLSDAGVVQGIASEHSTVVGRNAVNSEPSCPQQ